MIALLEASRAGEFQRRHWVPNIVAGVIVGVVALPLAVLVFSIEGPFFFGAVDSLDRALAHAHAGLVRVGPKRRYYSTLALAMAHSGDA